MDRKYYVWGGVLLALVLVVGIIYPRPTSVVERIVEKLGATPGDTLNTESWTVNGVRTYFYSSAFGNASTTVCSFRTPSATTTVVMASMNFTNGTTSQAVGMEIAKGAFQTASTTSLGTMALAAGITGTLVAVTKDAATGDETTTIAPRNYVTMKFGGIPVAAQSSTGFVGKCNIELREN